MNTKLVVAVFFIWRLLLFLIAYFANFFISDFGNQFPYSQEVLKSTGLPNWAWSFGNFDGVHYVRIAQDGYAYQFTQAFFPLYPILIRLVSYITFGNFLISALLISNLAFLVGLFLFYQLIRKNFNEKIAFWACL